MCAFDPSEYSNEVVEMVYQPWTIEVKPYSDGGYFARVVELPGCMTEADTAAEALEALEDARAGWIATAIEEGTKIPQPVSAGEYSGKIFVRTSPQLHRLVTERAAMEGVSMAQWVSEVLAREVGSSSFQTIASAVQEQMQQVLGTLNQGTLTEVQSVLKALEPNLDLLRTLTNPQSTEALREVVEKIAAGTSSAAPPSGRSSSKAKAS